MNEVEAALYKTRKSLFSFLNENGYDEQYQPINIIQCSSCNLWIKKSSAIKDLDGLEICKECELFYGL